MQEGEKGMKIHELVEGVEYRTGIGKVYKKEDGTLFRKLEHTWIVADDMYNSLANAVFMECEFSPMNGEGYYFPVFDDIYGYDHAVWNDDSIDFNIKKAVGVYRTREQAIEKARELGWVE